MSEDKPNAGQEIIEEPGLDEVWAVTEVEGDDRVPFLESNAGVHGHLRAELERHDLLLPVQAELLALEEILPQETEEDGNRIAAVRTRRAGTRRFGWAA